MSIDYRVFLGAHVFCENSYEEKAQESYSCPNKNCKHYHSSFIVKDNFCGSCGSKIEICNIPEIGYKIDCFKVPIEEDLFYWKRYDNRYANDGMDENKGRCYDLWFSNRKDNLGITLNHRDTSFFYHKITPELIETELNAFNKLYAKEIKILEEAYGKENVEVRYDFVCYSH